MVIIELDKEDVEYAERISDLADMSIVIDEPRSFSSELNSVLQLGITLAPYVIPAVALIIIELIKNKREVRIIVTDDRVEIDGVEEEKALQMAKELISLREDAKAQKIISDLLLGKKTS